MPFQDEVATPVQREVDTRRRCYQERLARRLNVKHDNWELEYGWTDADKAPYANLESGMSYSACDVLRYKPPKVVPCDQFEPDHPVAPPLPGDGVFTGVARLDLASRDPKRQQELFGWVTPDPKDLAGQINFEAAKTAYWAKVLDEDLFHLEVLKETADFKANDLIRVLYLAGDVPIHLRAEQPWWRAADALDRDPNFSADIEQRITTRLLEFKYWVDDPFFIDGGFNPKDATNIQNVRHHLVDDPNTPQAHHFDGGDIDHEMTFWSENHQILFASSEYLAGQWWPDEVFRAGRAYRGEGPDTTRPGDLTGRQRMAHVRPRLLRWLDDRLRLGFSEWNGPGYYEEDFPPLFNLADFCVDKEIRTRAQMVLDILIFDLARFTHRGSFGVTAGRCYYEHKDCGYEQSVGDLIEVLFGTRRRDHGRRVGIGGRVRVEPRLPGARHAARESGTGHARADDRPVTGVGDLRRGRQLQHRIREPRRPRCSGGAAPRTSPSRSSTAPTRWPTSTTS